MADNNNNLVADMPSTPNPALKKLERLLGTWKISSDFVTGTVRFEWMEGGFFMLQHVDFQRDDHKIKGIEYIGFDEDTQTLRSHLMDNNGSNFTYTWDLEGDTLRIWFGEKDSDNFYVGHFNDAGDSYAGRWQWPGGGYEAVATKQTQAV
jgi:hypothetical protein